MSQFVIATLLVAPELNAQSARPLVTMDATGTAAAAPVEVVVTGTRTPESHSRSTLHTGLVTREEAERRGATSVAEALEGESGLQVNPQAYDYLGGPAGVMMQGLDADRVLILRDGERLSGDVGGVIDLSEFSMHDVSRIEYVLGPTSSLYGTGALGGVVNILTGGPKTEGFSGRARLEARSLLEQLLGATSSYRAGNHWVSTSTSYRHNDGVKYNPNLPDLALAEVSRFELGVHGGVDDPEVETVVQILVGRAHSEGLTSQEVPGLGRYLIDLPDTSKRIHLRMRQTYHLDSKAELRTSSSGQYFAGESVKDRRASPIDELRRREQTLFGFEAALTYAESERTWVLGLRGEQETFEQTLSKVISGANGFETTNSAEVSPVLLRSGALFAQLGWDNGDAWTLLPGLRAELHKRFGAVVAPRLAAAFRPQDGVQLRCSVGRGFRAPSAKEYGFQFDHSFLGYRVLGNPDLEPEQSWGVQADATYTLEPRVTVRVGGFHNWIESLIVTNFVGSSSPGVDDYSYVNVGRARTLGLDATMVWRVMPTLQSELTYSYLFTRNGDTGVPLPSRPEHTVLSTLNYRPTNAWELTLRSRSVSDAYVTHIIDTPGFLKLDARVAYSLNHYVQAYVGVLNALDAKRDPAWGPGDQRSVVGRLFYAGLSAHYEQGM